MKENPFVQAFSSFVYSNRAFFFASSKQRIRVLCYQICCLLVDDLSVFSSLIHTFVIKNNSTYLEQCCFLYLHSFVVKLSTQLLLSKYKTELNEPEVNAACSSICFSLLQELKDSTILPQFDPLLNQHSFSVFDSVLLSFISESSCEENALRQLHQLVAQSYQFVLFNNHYDVASSRFIVFNQLHFRADDSSRW